MTFVIPAAIGSALNPTIFAGMTAVLSEDVHPRRKGVLFLCGGVVALLVWVAILSSVLWSILKQVESDAREHLNVIDITLGVLLLLLAGYLVIFKPKSLFGSDAKAKTAAQEDDGRDHIWRYGGLGFVLQVRDISSIVLFIAALEHIATAPIDWPIKVLVLIFTMSITLTAMWLPLVAHVRIPAAFSERVAPYADWLRDHSRPIAIWVSVLFGVYLVVRGIIEV